MTIDLSSISDEELLSLEKLARNYSEHDILEKIENIPHIPGHSIVANGCLYLHEKLGFASALMEQIFSDRVKYKNRMLEEKKKLVHLKEGTDEYVQTEKNISKYHNLQLAKKIQINSFYGALANPYFRWFNFDMAESITSSGQMTIKWIERDVNFYLNKLLKTENVDFVIASDTDSLYINMEMIVTHLIPNSENLSKKRIVEILDEFCKGPMQKMIDKSFARLASKMNAHKQKMFMKRETIADKGIWKAKKMYILNAWDVEGVRYETPEIKIQGIEAVRSSTPKVCRTAIKDSLNVIMNGTEESTQEFIKNFRDKFYKMDFLSVAFPRGVSDITSYADKHTIYSKGTPIHVKGSLLYNHLLDEKGLSKKYPKINNGDKIKFAYLKLPNPIKDRVISCPEQLPPELNIEKFIDYETQFEKTFLDPVKSILDVIGWDVEKRSTLEEFFS